MTLTKIISIFGLLLALGACTNNSEKEARPNGGPQGPGNPNKPTPPVVKVIEKFRDAPLLFQKPTLTESEFLNVLDLEFGDAQRAYFSFKYAPDEDGTFYFTLAQVRLHLQECKTPGADPKYKMAVYWQHVQDGKRVIEKEFSPSIEDYSFKKGQQYILTFSILDLKDVADCKGAVLKFATFKKNF